MKLNLSSQIVLNQIPEEFYRPTTAIERSEITRFEKVPTDIFPTIEEGAIDIANHLEADIKTREQALVLPSLLSSRSLSNVIKLAS